MSKLLLYTREAISEEEYSAKLADSLHVAIVDESGCGTVLNHNSGVFFAKATENEDGSLNAKSLKFPVAISDGTSGFFIYAIRIEPDGSADSELKGKLLKAYTKDFVTFEELEPVEYFEEYFKCILPCKKDELRNYLSKEEYNSYVNQKDGAEPDSTALNVLTTGSNIPENLPEGCIPSAIIDIDEALEKRIRTKLLTPENIAIKLPEKIRVSSKEELEKIEAIALYSDGSTAKKQIDWDLSDIDFSKKEIKKVKASVRQKHFNFPLAIDRADPCAARWNGKWYFIATNDADKNHTLYMREADSIEGLFTAKESLILDSDTYEDIGNLLWAPEFHEINGKLYIFHAATSGEFFCEESHICELKEGGNPMERSDWSRPKRVVKADGTDICEAGKTITLDMTCFEVSGEYYVVWSQRQFIPKDLGAWLYIAKLNPDKPWMLATEPVVLSKPEYGWANNHTFVDEGPFALIRDNKIFLTLSSALVDSTYVVSMMWIEKGKDLLCRENWKKDNFPRLTARSTPGEYGTGHNAYVEDEFGDIWNAYHARPGVDGPRSTGIRRVHFGFDGEPILDMHEEQDVKPELKNMEVYVEVC